ncbi:MAG: DUF87 domain-containing protein, partial [Bacillota bacterium]
DSRQVYVLPLSSQVQNDRLVGTGLCCFERVPDTIPDAAPGCVFSTDDGCKRLDLVRVLTRSDYKADLVGFVVEDSSISRIHFEKASAVPLQAGSLVFCRQGDVSIYYQVIDAKTKEESFDQNPRGIHVVTAAQLGILDPSKGFRKYPWLPDMNSPVFCPLEPVKLAGTSVPSVDELTLGVVCGSTIPVKANLEALMDFHTAILGVTGTGKTELSFDIIRYALGRNVKVFCVDFTGEYAGRLGDLTPDNLGLDESHSTRLDELMLNVELGSFRGETEKKVLNKFISEIKPGIVTSINSFLSSEGSKLGIFELPDIANTRTGLRATELYLSEIFNWARRHRRARRILLVLEEAHTIVPETNLFGFDKNETPAIVGRMSQIALQGRKYGVGLLVVSQRTALVSKTVLSQCNTFITFSLVDQTSLEFLENVYGETHVKAVPNLPLRQA